MQDEEWNSTQRALSGRSDLVGGDQYELRIAIPGEGNWKIDKAVVADANCNIRVSAERPNIARVVIETNENREVNWSVSFK